MLKGSDYSFLCIHWGRRYVISPERRLAGAVARLNLTEAGRIGLHSGVLAVWYGYMNWIACSVMDLFRFPLHNCRSRLFSRPDVLNKFFIAHELTKLKSLFAKA